MARHGAGGGVNWICCQIGAREHYAIARALHRLRLLELLFTDIWGAPRRAALLGPRVAQRFHSELATARVISANGRNIGFELQSKVTGLRGWKKIVRRNKWFQNWVVKQLANLPNVEQPRTLFAYSYAARRQFQFARTRGWRTVLGQIDPGRCEERLVHKLHKESGTPEAGWRPPPAQYWHDWREECELSDFIIVNSEWARDGLLAEGILAEKLHIIPLAFEDTTTHAAVQPRQYPREFSNERPLRVLFLGQITLRKGVRELFEAVRRLRGKPVEFWFVGPIQSFVPPDLRLSANMRWTGPVSRHEVDAYYRKADVFILPTLSDGFALTQLEAMAHRLPVIASRFCGNVVRDGVDGIVLRDVTPLTIVESLLFCLQDPARLSHFSQSAHVREQFGLDSLSQRLIDLG